MLIATYVADAAPVLAPTIAALFSAILCFVVIWRKDRRLDIFEIGPFYVALVCLYAVYPAVSYLTGGLEFGLFSDTRIYQAQPTPSQLAPIFWDYVIYISAFVCAYLRLRGNAPKWPITLVRPPARMVSALILTLVFIKLFFVGVRFVYGIQTASTYNEQYLLYKNLPLILQQILNHFNGMIFTLEILVVIALAIDFRRNWKWIGVWIAVDLVSIVVGGVGSRTELFVLLLGTIIAYHYLVRPLPLRTALWIGFVGVVLFTALGVVRSQIDYSETGVINPLAFDNEFESILANAYDVSQLKAAGELKPVIPDFYFADIMSIVPRQLVPFQKIDLATWYAKTFYPNYADTGGAFAFGAIAESIVGFGWPDALWRGALLGAIFAYLRRRFLNSQQSLWSFGLYVWVLIFAYQCIRATTFALLPRLFYEFLLLWMWIYLLSNILALFHTPRNINEQQVPAWR